MITFTGNTSWEQAKQTEWSVDSWGVDHAKLLWRGRSTLKDAFENNLRKFEGMPGFPLMKLEGWNSTILSPSFPGVELNFIGLKSGTVPEAKCSQSLTLASAQGQGTDSITGRQVSGSFNYLASRTSWSWFERQLPPILCPKTEILDRTDPLSRIVSYSIQDSATGQANNNILYSAFVAVFNTLVRKVLVTNYEYEEVFPDNLWACKCDIDFKVVN
jgi:hypothetical protein